MCPPGALSGNELLLEDALDPGEPPHRLAVVDGVLRLGVGEIEPLLQEVDAQHLLEPQVTARPVLYRTTRLPARRPRRRSVTTLLARHAQQATEPMTRRRHIDVTVRRAARAYVWVRSRAPAGVTAAACASPPPARTTPPGPPREIRPAAPTSAATPS